MNIYTAGLERGPMGKTSKPLTITVDKSLYDCDLEAWNKMEEQGFTIVTIQEKLPDLYIAPYAMRMTRDMMTNLPTALDLAIKGARALRYAPHGAMLKEGSKHVKAKKPRARKNSKVTVEDGADRNSQVEGQDTGVGGDTISTVSDTTNNERVN